MDFVSQQYWDKSYKDFNYHIANDALTNWIESKIDLFGAPQSLFEFGCYPGRYLSFMGKKGWEVSGVDLTPGIEENFEEWLHSQGIKTKLIAQKDALRYAENTTDHYKLVCSFGFIEHFENFLQLIELHDKILEPGGWLMITTPNFKGSVQKFLHKTFNEETLAIHYLPSMQPKLWKEKLETLGYKIHFAGYFGGFDFWYDEVKRNQAQKLSLKVIRKLTPLLSKLPENSAYSSYCGIVARKNH